MTNVITTFPQASTRPFWELTRETRQAEAVEVELYDALDGEEELEGCYSGDGW